MSLVFFAHYLAAIGAFEALVANTPLLYGSNCAHAPRDGLGTLLVGILAGQHRYAAPRGPTGRRHGPRAYLD